ncbi:unnamed protein product [Didymodactylos carnosus]|uniref:Uncharacterized protein n=1 Tax=Didymodactylos carnosus TaxID=1234261 RepID=A0A8S2MU05_9BILA|nr:unnamed protein product [Didymodactylos carnosus]CAF3973205.1 unnamed protein product [Didymodactylos carnosus]
MLCPRDQILVILPRSTCTLTVTTSILTTTSTTTANTTSSASANTSSTVLTTTTTTVLTTTTTANVCLDSNALVTVLFTLSLIAPQNYTFYSCVYTATAGHTLGSLIFSLRNDPAYWFLDDVSVKSVSTSAELLTNGGFESGSLTSSWIYCNPVSGSSSSQVTMGNQRTGTYCYRDGSSNSYDYLSQKLTMISGSQYNISFWLASRLGVVVYTNGTVLAQVTLQF